MNCYAKHFPSCLKFKDLDCKLKKDCIKHFEFIASLWCKKGAILI